MSSVEQQAPLEETKTPENWQKTVKVCSPEIHRTVLTSCKDKLPSQYTDPCKAAAKASFRCLDENDYDRDACLRVFADYRECKAAWCAQLTPLV